MGFNPRCECDYLSFLLEMLRFLISLSARQQLSIVKRCVLPLFEKDILLESLFVVGVVVNILAGGSAL